MSIYLGNTEIGSLYLGNTEIGEAYLGSTKVFSGDSPTPVLPYDAEVEYLENDGGTQRINLPLNVSVGSYFEVGGQVMIIYQSNETNVNPLLAADVYNNYDINFYSATSAQTVFSSKIGNQANAGGVGGGMVFNNGVVSDFALSTTFTKVGDTINMLARPLTSKITNLYLFGRKESNYNGKLHRIYSCYVKVGDTVVYDLIPVRVEQVGYLYDRISGELFGNSGTGNFTIGNDKNQ